MTKAVVPVQSKIEKKTIRVLRNILVIKIMLAHHYNDPKTLNNLENGKFRFKRKTSFAKLTASPL